MPGERLPLRRVRDALRLHADKLSKRLEMLSLEGVIETALTSCVRARRLASAERCGGRFIYYC